MKILFSVLAFFLFHSSFAQIPTWLNTINGTGKDQCYSFDVDASGNTYACGRFTGTVDFDPSSNIYNLTSNGMTDVYLAKYASNGNLIWVFGLGANEKDAALKVKINYANEVLITGCFRNNVDFDPSTNTFFLNATGLAGTDNADIPGGDIFLAKYTSNGNFIWAFKIASDYLHDKPEGLDVDLDDNIYLAGAVNGTSASAIDADPGAGFYNIGGQGHAFVAKYTTNTNFIWAFNYGEFGQNSGVNDIKVVPNDTSFIITGFFRGTNVDFDPNAGTYLRTSNGAEDIVVGRYSLNKKFMWAYTTGGPSADVGIDVDFDQNDNLYVSGWFNGTNIDFDPMSSTAFLTSNGGYDAYVFKYSLDGNYLWAKQFGGTSLDIAWCVSVKDNELIIGGEFGNTVDFDPNLTIYNLTSNGGSDIFVSRLDTNANFLCANQIGGSLDEMCLIIRRTYIDTFLIAGRYSTNNLDFDPTATTFIKTNTGAEDAFIGKYSLANVITSYTFSIGGDTICAGVTPNIVINSNPIISGTFDVNYTIGTNNYIATGVSNGVPFNLGGTFTSTTNVIINSLIPNSSIAVCASNSILVNDTIPIVVNPSPAISTTATPSSLCQGASTILTASGASTYSWTGGVINGVAFVPPSTATYTVTGTDVTTGCTGTTTANVLVNSAPTVIANASPPYICSGSTSTFTGSGATSYSWTGGIINTIPFSPISSATYTVTGMDANGCTNTSSIYVAVNSLPTVAASVNPSSLCQGASAILSGSGASSYTWTGGIINATSFMPSSSSTYTVTGTDANGCSATSTISINVNALPNVNATAFPSSVCYLSPTTLTAVGASTYSWSNGITNGISFIPVASATYTVTGTDANGCTNTSTAAINVSGNIILNITPPNPILCIDDSMQLQVTGANTYSWGPNNFINGVNTSNPFIYPPSNSTYTVMGKDANGCTSTAEIFIEVIEEPVLTLTKSNDVECNYRTVQLNVSGANTYLWSPASILSAPNSASTNATLNETTTFTITASKGTCVVTDSITVYVINNDPSSIFIPNAFSPNGDGLNDCLRVTHRAHFLNYYFAIYNRWGQRVFESDNPDDCWNGMVHGKQSQLSTYYYFLNAETNCSKIAKKGDVTLIR